MRATRQDPKNHAPSHLGTSHSRAASRPTRACYYLSSCVGVAPFLQYDVESSACSELSTGHRTSAAGARAGGRGVGSCEPIDAQASTWVHIAWAW
jgi:hypothetical protein